MNPTEAKQRASTTACVGCGVTNRVPVIAASGYPRCSRCGETLPWVVAASDSDYDAALEGSVLVLVDVWAQWCAPCRLMTPVIERLAEEYRGRLKVVTVDVDACPATANSLVVQGIPTVLLVRSGSVIERLVGARSQPELESRVLAHLSPAA